ncbi:adenylyl cyclase X E isoform X1 [Drosophila takahashii]|uniref:adenylyl cyclase X E isoform X1 n=2 Tax=Drosophila takahashii TaxID=29030 RepID=UPI001CF83AF0|nr:adenylyl cyclase X E [Drosophila takahashii]
MDGYQEDVVAYRSLSTIKGLECRHLRKKCRNLRLELACSRLRELAMIANVGRVIWHIELLMIIHIILLLSLVRDIVLVSLLPYLIIMILTPCIMIGSMQEDVSFTVHLLISCLMAFFLTIMDISSDLLGTIHLESAYPIVPTYDHVVLVCVYMALPIAFFKGYCVYILGLTVSLVYLGFVWYMQHLNDQVSLALLGSYAIYLFILNLIFSYFTVLRDYCLRRSILTRYQLVYQNIVYQTVMKKEKALLESILPRRMIRTLQEEICSRIEDQDKKFTPLRSTSRKLFLEPYPEVSCLVADMVNYTHLTTTLEAAQLVEILHDLFVNFDMAANRNRAMRIKFLGDAYNCVAGIPNYFPAHASCCVDQALEMIRITQDISGRRNLAINLRIGVHSGEVFAGIIGLTKWQFDIWSKDVDITNRLEMTGLPGLVHVSQRTLSMLDDHYVFSDGTEVARNDTILKQAGIRTYLVSSRLPDTVEPGDLDQDYSNASITSYRLSYAGYYEDLQIKAQREMMKEVEQMAVGHCIFECKRNRLTKSKGFSEEQLFNKRIHLFLGVFRSWKTEWGFHNQPDLMMKYTMILVCCAGLAILTINLIEQADKLDIFVLVGILLVLLILCFLAGYKKLRRQCKRLTPMSQPSCFLSRWLLRISERIEDSIFLRVPLAIIVMLLLYVMSSQTVFSCDVAKLELGIIDAHLHNEKSYAECFGPWTVTYSVVIVLSLLFVTLGCPLIIKMTLGLVILGLHLGTVHFYYGFAFERSETTDLGLKADYAHTWYLVAFFIILIMRDRHHNYLKKVSYFMRICYEETHKRTDDKLRSIKIIMANMLPSHVAEVFKVRRPNDQLYSETFSKVAVMFASIENFNADTAGLRILHEIICCFDDLLVEYQMRYKIEKIKVMGWTYMAACGLQVDHYTDFSIDIPVKQPETESEMRRRSSVLTVHFGSTEDDEMSGDTVNQPLALVQDGAVLVMTEFALDLLRIMYDIRYNVRFSEYDSFASGSLKIGISHGPVMAGVVGLSKPHYDIWGHTVNMASRMTSTGLLDNIQVTRHTAKVLRQFNIRCNYRAHTEVKGVGKVPTYLVVIDPDLTFQDHDQVSMSVKSSKSMILDNLPFAPSYVAPKASSTSEEEEAGEEEDNQEEDQEEEEDDLEERQKGGFLITNESY